MPGLKGRKTVLGGDWTVLSCLGCWSHGPARVAHFRTVRPAPADENEPGQNTLKPASTGKAARRARPAPWSGLDCSDVKLDPQRECTRVVSLRLLLFPSLRLFQNRK